MTKAKKIILIVCLAIVAIVVTAYLGAVFWYYYAFNNAVSGFEIVNSMIYLTVTDKDYVDLGGERYIVKEGGAQSLVTNEFESYSSYAIRDIEYDEKENFKMLDSEYLKGLEAEKDGVKYEYSAGYFDSNKFILVRGEPIA